MALIYKRGNTWTANVLITSNGTNKKSSEHLSNMQQMKILSLKILRVMLQLILQKIVKIKI